jgi:Integron Cassette Protein Hfx_Cass5
MSVLTGFAMPTDPIEAIGIDFNGSLWVKPATATFPFMYRAAMGVQWDEHRRCLYAPKPREWTYLDWFRQIRKEAADECREALEITPATAWDGIDATLRSAMEASQGSG